MNRKGIEYSCYGIPGTIKDQVYNSKFYSQVINSSAVRIVSKTIYPRDKFTSTYFQLVYTCYFDFAIDFNLAWFHVILGYS
jgi:hypothetical protein